MLLYNRVLILWTIAILFTFNAFSQSPGIEWQKTIPGSLGRTLLLSDSNMILAGGSIGTNGSNDIRICKLGRDGNIIWNKTLGGSAREVFLDFVGTSDGGFMLAATTLSGDGDVVGFHGPSNGSNDDIWVVKLSAAGTIQWQKSIGGSGTETFRQLLIQSDGSTLILGTTSNSGGDFGGAPAGSFLAKLDQNGTMVFANIIGDYRTAFKKMILKPNGNLLIIGDNISLGNNGSVDLSVQERNQAGLVVKGGSYGGVAVDASVDVLQTGAEQFTVLAYSGSPGIPGAHGGDDLWLLTFNNSGNIIWQKALGGSGNEQNASIYFNPADSTIMMFASTNSNDGDVSGNHGGADIWVTKLSNVGTLLWQRCLGGSGYDGCTLVQKDAGNQTYMLGTTTSNDGDVSGYHGGVDAWFVKLNTTGSPEWQKCLGGTLDEQPVSFNIEPNGFTLLTATPSQDGDVHGMHYKGDTIGTNFIYKNDIWVVNLGSSGGINWQRSLGGYDSETPGSVYKIKGKYYVTGNTSSNNGDVSGSHKEGNKMWVVQLGPSNIIKGNVFIDANRNGIKDPGEGAYDDVIVKSEKNNYARWSIPFNGRFTTDVDTGSFTTTITLEHPYYTAVPVSKQTTFTGYFQVDSIDFAMQPAPGKRDLEVNIFNTGASRPGFNSYHHINYKNLGTDTIAFGKVYMFKDSNTIFVSAIPAPDDIMGDTLSWNYSNLLPNNGGSIAITLNIKAPPKVNAGDTLKHWVSIEPDANDLVPGNNRDSIRRITTGSFDPNDKSENHAGYISMASVANREALSYVINFQNVGTDTAFTIVVRDTLSDKLDWNTLQIVGASHSSSLQIIDGNKCVWTFNNINLPPVGTNEPLSHGYIAYSIKPKASVLEADIIKNSAAIYFDYNLPVITNTTVIMVKPDEVVQPVISGLVNNYCGNQAMQKIKIINLPASSATTTTIVKLDATVLTVAADSSISFDVSTLAAGPHTLSISYSNSIGTKTTTATFTVIAAVLPDVNVSSNILQVTNLSTPVIITAANAAGGGKDPLYTFAWNNQFTNIIQTESNNNVLTITSSALTIGDNKVYVKMKTSEACYKGQTSVDSITIRRDQSTGILDADNPGQVITAYPNPFKGALTVTGLSTAKTYIITVYNLKGQTVFSKRIANRATTYISQIQHAAGAYWLSIYDDKNKRLIGSIQLIKQ